MKTGFGFFLAVILLVTSITVSCDRKINLRDRTAVAYVTDHFSHSYYADYLTLVDVEIVDERVIYESAYEMEVHTLQLLTAVDIKESYVVGNFRFGNFLEIDESWSIEMQRRINNAESEEEIEQIKETYSQYTFEKGFQKIRASLDLTWNETEGRWMVLNMRL